MNIASHKNIIEVQPMNEAEALDLLQKKLSIPAEHENMVEPAEALEFMPLAIVQAAGYININHPVAQYRNTSKIFRKVTGKLYGCSTMRLVFFTDTGRPRTLFSSHGKYPLTIFEG